ncbi:unnamed protein product [Tilletia controversa]|uniref:Protein ARV n=3 Tax=Tilletia TaxID=13289 RepID=A0A8X7MWR1_9BASI|nr:hypothetical protein CF336_g1886 [Tilletia laevis]KAE8203088.1 hypothetical protein CF328_g1846 [Tilletia controversa]KAE8263822.1 hypothetical protein A4X03_0g1388 [Tilletia caries]KAE8206473.1 hypothetical protein CF335_g1865 [Tilletia laevis]KAE8252232.1 hypothetical protein A4X06_0g2335 [Tilletia controversa]
MSCLCVQCGTPQTHLYVRYSHGGVLSAPCEACHSESFKKDAGTEQHQGTGVGAGTATTATAIKRAADPYVENDDIVVFLDLILVKPRAFRHLLFNRPLLRHADENGQANQKSVGGKDKGRGNDSISYLPDVTISARTAWLRATRSFVAIQLVDAFLRWYYLCAYDNAKERRSDIAVHPLLTLWLGPQASPRSVLSSYLLVFSAVVAEALVYHASVTLLISGYVAVCRRVAGSRGKSSSSVDLFRPHLVVNALLLANVSAFFLLSLILLWEARYQQPGTNSPAFVPNPTSADLRTVLDFLAYRLRTWQPDTIIRHLVAGLSSGVALAVVLPRAPLITTTSILVGWTLAAVVRTQTLLPSHSGGGTAQTIEGLIAAPFYCPVWPQ